MVSFRPDRLHPGSTVSRPARPGQRGFTLVELMVTLAVLGILAALAMPSFTEIINRNRLAGLSNDVAAVLQTARAESMRRRVRVVVCASSDGIACTNNARWRGWIVFADLNGNNVLNDTDPVIRSEVLTGDIELWTSNALSSTGSIVVFRHDGFAYDATRTTLLAANFSACLPTTRPQENARIVSLVTGARISVATATDAPPCGAPANPV